LPSSTAIIAGVLGASAALRACLDAEDTTRATAR